MVGSEIRTELIEMRDSIDKFLGSYLLIDDGLTQRYVGFHGAVKLGERQGDIAIWHTCPSEGHCFKSVGCWGMPDIRKQRVHYDFVIWPDRTRKIPISNDYTSRDGISRKFEIFLREIISPASLVGIEHESDYRRDFNLKRWFLDLFLPSFYQTAKAGLWLVSAAIFFSFGLVCIQDMTRTAGRWSVWLLIGIACMGVGCWFIGRFNGVFTN